MPDGSGGQSIGWVASLWAWVVLVALSLWGGTASYISRLKRSKQAFSLVELIGEWVVSGFAGLMAALACLELGLSFPIAAAAAGVAGHMGGRSIYMLERVVVSWYEKKYGVKLPNTHKDRDHHG